MKKTLVFSILFILASAVACTESSKVKEITYEDFINEIWDFNQSPKSFVFKGNTAVIVDFTAKWCGPCQLLAKHLEKLADEYEGQLTVYKVNAEKEKELSMNFHVEGLPVLFFIPKSGEYLRRVNGLPTEEELRTIIEEQLIN
jgi:thioredoxin 1